MNLQEVMNQATEHLQAGRLSNAEALFRQVIAQQPKHADAYHLMGCAAAKGNRPVEAVELIRRAIELDPKQSVFYNNLGLAFLILGNKAEAMKVFRQAISIDPKNADSYNHLGNAFCELGDFGEAIKYFQSAVGLQPDHPYYQYNLATGFFRKANSSPQSTQEERIATLQLAVDAFERTLALRPDYSDAANNLGITLQMMGRKDDAIGAWKRAAAGGKHFYAFYNLGRALFEKDLIDEAFAAMRSAFQINPNNAEALNNLGNLFRQTGQPDQAIAQFERAIMLQPDFPVAHSNRLYSIYYSPLYDANRIFQEHKRWGEYFQRKISLSSQAFPNVPDPRRRLKIGYVSPNFWGHCQALFTVPLFRITTAGNLRFIVTTIPNRLIRLRRNCKDMPMCGEKLSG